MKTLIIGEVNNNELSSGTLEIISKAKELSLDFSVITICLLYTSPSPRDRQKSRMPSSA